MKSSVLHPRSDSRNWPRSSECGISLRYVGFKLFKKILLVALGVWLSKPITLFLIYIHTEY